MQAHGGVLVCEGVRLRWPHPFAPQLVLSACSSKFDADAHLADISFLPQPLLLTYCTQVHLPRDSSGKPASSPLMPPPLHVTSTHVITFFERTLWLYDRAACAWRCAVLDAHILSVLIVQVGQKPYALVALRLTPSTSALCVVDLSAQTLAASPHSLTLNSAHVCLLESSTSRDKFAFSLMYKSSDGAQHVRAGSLTLSRVVGSVVHVTLTD